jgi:CheY-like chemotaxis protein/anti-sigma regulatory factor (Ser/Thr protein kinase)
MSGAEGSLGDIRRALASITARLDALAAAVGARRFPEPEPPGTTLDEPSRTRLAPLESLLDVAGGTSEAEACLLAVDRARWHAQADCATVFLLEDGGRWRPLAQRGFPTVGPSPAGEVGGIVARAAALGEPVQAGPDLGGPDPWLAGHGLEAAVAVPVTARDGIVKAVLLAARRRPARFDTGALGALLVVTARLADALAAGATSRDEWPAAFFASLDLPVTAGAVAEAVRARLGAAAVAVLVPEAEGMVLAGGVGLPADAQAPDATESPLATALRTRQPWVPGGDATTARGLAPCLGTVPRAVLPLVAEDAVVALLLVGSPETCETALPAAFARHAAIALRHARVPGAARRGPGELGRPPATPPGATPASLADLASLLAVILGRLAAVRERAVDAEALRELAVAEEAAWRAADAVRHVLGFAPGPRLSPTAVLDLAAVVQGGVQAVQGRWAAAGGGPRVSLDLGPVPPVRGNPDELRHALEHLLQNAREAGDAATPIGVRLRWDGGTHVEVAVADQGRGMDEATRVRAGEPFFTTKGPGRLGVGLAVARAVAARHHGDLEVESAPGCGTTVRLRLPTAAARLPRPPDAAAVASLSRPRVILVVEDEVPVREAVALGLAGDDLVVRAADDIAPALALLQQETVDAVVTDLALPGGSGLEVARVAKRVRPATVVVLMTGWPGRLEGQTLESHGVDAVVEKPVGLDTLRATLTALLARPVGPRP